MMTRQDFEIIAKVITELPNRPTHTQVIEAFAEALAETNPHFDPERFRTACQPIYTTTQYAGWKVTYPSWFTNDT